MVNKNHANVRLMDFSQVVLTVVLNWLKQNVGYKDRHVWPYNLRLKLYRSLWKYGENIWWCGMRPRVWYRSVKWYPWSCNNTLRKYHKAITLKLSEISSTTRDIKCILIIIIGYLVKKISVNAKNNTFHWFNFLSVSFLWFCKICQ